MASSYYNGCKQRTRIPIVKPSVSRPCPPCPPCPPPVLEELTVTFTEGGLIDINPDEVPDNTVGVRVRAYGVGGRGNSGGTGALSEMVLKYDNYGFRVYPGDSAISYVQGGAGAGGGGNGGNASFVALLNNDTTFNRYLVIAGGGGGGDGGSVVGGAAGNANGSGDSGGGSGGNGAPGNGTGAPSLFGNPGIDFGLLINEKMGNEGNGGAGLVSGGGGGGGYGGGGGGHALVPLSRGGGGGGGSYAEDGTIYRRSDPYFNKALNQDDLPSNTSLANNPGAVSITYCYIA